MMVQKRMGKGKVLFYPVVILGSRDLKECKYHVLETDEKENHNQVYSDVSPQSNLCNVTNSNSIIQSIRSTS